MKANHNYFLWFVISSLAVSNGSKILKWKQITTTVPSLSTISCCFQWFKDTKMKANHNKGGLQGYALSSCFQWFKDTKMKANHNITGRHNDQTAAVSNGSKILKWKQITTEISMAAIDPSCFQWFKDTKMKANHNGFDFHKLSFALFPMVQRY